MPSDANPITPLLRARHPAISIVTADESHAVELAYRAAADCGLEVARWSAVVGLRVGMVEGQGLVDNTEHPAAALFHAATLGEPVLLLTLDLASHLESDPRTVRAWRELVHRFEHTRSHLVMVDHEPSRPPIVDEYAARVDLPFPDDDEIESLVMRTLRSFNRESKLDIGVRERDMDTIVRNLRGLSRRQIERIIADCIATDRTFDRSDITRILEQKRRLLSGTGVLEHVDTPADLEGIAGLRRLKRWLGARERAFGPDAKDFGLDPPRGVLMLGVQGTGKSLTAKAVATAWSRPLLRLDPGRLYNKYVGESDRTLRDALAQAEAMAPIVLWIDEIEKGFAAVGGAGSNDGGLSKRMFGTLLTWMNDHTSPVFLIATANDIDALPPELLRKGRFDEIFFVDLPAEDVRREVFAIHLRKRRRDPESFDLDALAEASGGFSPAEIEQAVVAALHNTYETRTGLTTDHVLEVLAESPPLSVTAAEKVAHLQAWAKDRCVPAD